MPLSKKQTNNPTKQTKKPNRLPIIDFRFNMISYYCISLFCYQKRLCFSLEVFLSQLCPCFHVCNLITLSLKISMQLFFYFLVFCYFSVYFYAANTVGFIIFIPSEISPLHLLMVFQWGLSDSKFSQVSRTLFNILVDFNNAVVMLVSSSSSDFKPLTKALGIVPSVSLTNVILVTFMFLSVFQLSGKVQLLVSLFVFFNFISVVQQNPLL